MASKRKDRKHKQSKQEDQRKEFQIDRDRLIYCFAFRRLAQVTQVASAKEGNVFHNRLTHSLKVAQVGRRLAEYLKSESKPDLKKQGEKLVESMWDITPSTSLLNLGVRLSPHPASDLIRV